MKGYRFEPRILWSSIFFDTRNPGWPHSKAFLHSDGWWEIPLEPEHFENNSDRDITIDRIVISPIGYSFDYITPEPTRGVNDLRTYRQDSISALMLSRVRISSPLRFELTGGLLSATFPRSRPKLPLFLRASADFSNDLGFIVEPTTSALRIHRWTLSKPLELLPTDWIELESTATHRAAVESMPFCLSFTQTHDSLTHGRNVIFANGSLTGAAFLDRREYFNDDVLPPLVYENFVPNKFSPIIGSKQFLSESGSRKLGGKVTFDQAWFLVDQTRHESAVREHPTLSFIDMNQSLIASVLQGAFLRGGISSSGKGRDFFRPGIPAVLLFSDFEPAITYHLKRPFSIRPRESIEVSVFVRDIERGPRAPSFVDPSTGEPVERRHRVILGIAFHGYTETLVEV